MKLTIHNSMVAGSPEKVRPAYDLSVLENQGYGLVAIDTLQVFNADPWARRPDDTLVRISDERTLCHVVLSGADTRVVAHKHPWPCEGPVMRDGHLDTEGIGSAHFRGAVAVLADGTVVMGRTNGSGAKELNKQFGTSGNPLVALIGGGALLVENRSRMDQNDLVLNQLFSAKLGGFSGRNMAMGAHGFMGIFKGKAYAGITTGRSGMDLRNDLFAEGFGTVIKFAHGKSLFWDNGAERVHGMNGVGFGIVRAR